jgi:histidyl-tRNA synthetase
MDRHECRCEAREDSECGCLGVDWSKIDREEIERLRAELAGWIDMAYERGLGDPEECACQLDEDAKRRLHSNPLRILDSKNPAMKALNDAAPKLLDFLGVDSLAHFNAVRAMLDANGVAYSINPRLVRGMDYYNLTVFEFITERLGSQGTVCGGGRYDDLVAEIGGKPAPAVGWALGVERVLELLKEQGDAAAELVPDVYAIIPEASALPQVLPVLQSLRQMGVSVQMHAPSGAVEGMGSMKSQFKKADSSGAHFALVFGPDELAQGQVTVKSLRDGQGAQRSVPLSEISAWGHSLQSQA